MFRLLAAGMVVVLGLSAPALADDNAARVADLVKRFTYMNVTSPDANRIFSDVGISSTFNPRTKMANPDPTWIPGWDKLELTDESQTAVLQSAINRTWTAQVHKDYARYRAAWAKIEKDLRPELDRARALPGFYARTAALVKLYDDVRKRAEGDKVFYEGKAAPATVGFVNDIVVALVAAHRDAKLEFRMNDFFGKHGIYLAEFIERGRPFATDAVERELFTAFSEDYGNLDTQALPTMRQYGHAFELIKWPTVKNAADAKREAAKLVEANAAELRPKTTLTGGIPSLFGDLPNQADPTLRWVNPPTGGTDSFSPLTVTKVTKQPSGGVVAVLVTKFDRSEPYACKNTNQLDTTGSGRVWQQACKYKHTIKTHTMEVTFPDLPEGLELAKGDEVALYVDLDSKKEKKNAIDYKLTARALITVKRGGKAIWE
ncbi:MAG: hypothetical protein HOV81_10725 [Kofleriaceae bacterium]|nr:hypothetical protein [Kofleriaceae bacterium]